MTAGRDPRERERVARTEAPEKERKPHEQEHDQDSEPPRTARAPNTPEIDDEWGRQEGC